MRDKIIDFLFTIKGKKSDRLIRKLVAEHFGGTITSGRYVKIGDEEWAIKNNPDCMDTRFCGYEVRLMTWKHGNDWKYTAPY